MKYLLDTHAIIWYFENSAELPERIEDLIDTPEISIFISSASLWEIAIKMSLGKLDLNLPLGELLEIIKKRDFNILQIEDEYLKNILNLPFIHKDPFDRLIISTALAEDLTIITIDENIQKYDVSWIW
jgi:PIN domain nuclease of toxin-antitoxin system